MSAPGPHSRLQQCEMSLGMSQHTRMELRQCCCTMQSTKREMRVYDRHWLENTTRSTLETPPLQTAHDTECPRTPADSSLFPCLATTPDTTRPDQHCGRGIWKISASSPRERHDRRTWKGTLTIGFAIRPSPPNTLPTVWTGTSTICSCSTHRLILQFPNTLMLAFSFLRRGSIRRPSRFCTLDLPPLSHAHPFKHPRYGTLSKVL